MAEYAMPAAFSGIASAYILGISHEIGETMILAVAAGMQPNLTLNPLEPAATVTAFIVQVALGRFTTWQYWVSNDFCSRFNPILNYIIF
jgi:phosphate transport system permease protein